MPLMLPSAPRIATRVVTLPVGVAARAFGLARGTLCAVRDVATGRGHQHTSPASPPAAPVNVTEELGLDAAPPTRPRPRREPAVTSIDERAEPGLVESTPADVAARLGRADDADDAGD